MIQQRGVIVTDNVHDYAVAISVHRQIAKSEGLQGCYPVQLPAKSSPVFQPLFTYYGLKIIEFATLFPGSDVVERSHNCARRYAAAGRNVRARLDAEPEFLAGAIGLCLEDEVPLVWSTAEEEVSSALLEASQANARQNHWLIVPRRSELAVAAMFYAQSTRKRVQFVDRMEEVLNPGRLDGADSVILVDEFASFNKDFLERLAAGQPPDGGGNSPAVLTAYSPAAFTGFIWRMLEHQAFRKSGRRSHIVKPFELVELPLTRPVEYSVIPEHGNESHMHYGHEVLCGAVSAEFRGEGKRSFNCEWSCPHEPRYSAAQLPIHHLLILSCNTFTLGDGVVTPEFSLLLNFLNGWPVSIIAPFQHAVVTPLAAEMTEALIQSGLNQGEVTRRLNSVSMAGSYRDPAFVLVGDPETVIGEHPARQAVTHITELSDGIEISFSEVHGRVAECSFPENVIANMLKQGQRPAVTSDCGSAQSGVYFSFTNQSGPLPNGLLIFADHDLPPGPWTVRIEPAIKPNEQERAKVREGAEKVRQHRIFGVDAALLSRMEEAVLSLLRSRSGYPAFCEMLRPTQPRNLTSALSERLHQIRRALLADLVRRTADRVWLNHQYADYYPLVRHLAPEPSRPRCSFCSNQTQRWRYEDDCTGLAARDMVICPRCGIVGDSPVSPEIEIELQPVSSIEGGWHHQRIVVTNHSDRTVELSYFVQFHSWKKLGVDGETQIYDAVIPSKGSVEREIAFHFARPLPDYIHDVMSYVLTDGFDLYSVGQRVATRQKGMFVARQGVHPQHDPHSAHHHHPQHQVHPEPQPGVPHQHSSAGLHSSDGDSRKNGKKRPIVIIEPHAALFRYLQVARRRFHVIVLTSRPDRCLQRERYYNRSMGFPTGTQLDRLIECDTTKVESMYEALAPFKETVAGVLAGDDVFVPISAELGRKFHFDYALPEDGTAQHLKTAMKRRFRERGVPTPRFVIAQSLDEARQAWEQLGRDCMVKMVDFEASMNVFRVASVTELEAAWDAIVNNRSQLKVPFPLAQEVILEEFVAGRELTIEGYVQGDRIVCLNFCEKITEKFIVVGHLLPALVSAREAEILKGVAEQCVQAVGMRNTVFHVEVHLRGDDPYVIECAARPPGANMVELMHRSYDFDLMEISLALAAGEPVRELPRPPKVHFAMLALYSNRSGTLDRLEGLEELQHRGGVVHVHLDVKPGDRIEPLAGMHQGDGFIMLEDSTAEGIREKAGWMRDHVELLLTEELEEAVA